MKIYILLMITGIITVSCINSDNNKAGSARNSAADTLFIYSHVWDVNLGFTSADWEAVSPKMPGGFGPGGFFAPGFIQDGDSDGNNLLSRQEFLTMGKKWFAKWDDKGEKHISASQIDKGIASVVENVNGGKLTLAGAEGERNGIATVLGVGFPTSFTRLDFQGVKFDSVSVRNKGNGTYLVARKTDKLSYKIDLNDNYPGRNIAGLVKINLHNCIVDPSFMNEVLAFKLFRDAGVPAPRTTYARLSVAVPGQFDQKYLGLYSVVENVDKKFLSDRFGTSKGAIFKPVTPFLFDYLGDNWNAYTQIYDPKTSLTGKEKKRLIDLCKLVTNSNDEEFASQIGSFLDLDELAGFLAVTVLISDLDGFIGLGQNFYLYLDPKTKKFVFIPWDQDHSFGQFKRSQEQREKLSIEMPWDKDNFFLERLFKVEKFKRTYLADLKKINETLFQPERIIAQVEELKVALRDAVKDESPEKLALFDHVVNWDPYKDESPLTEVNIQHGFPGSYGSEADVKPVQGFVVKRHLSVQEQLEGQSVGLEDDDPVDMGEKTEERGFSPVFLRPMDKDNDGYLTEEEFEKGFTQWYDSWHKEENEFLTTMDIRAGLNEIIGFVGPDTD